MSGLPLLQPFCFYMNLKKFEDKSLTRQKFDFFRRFELLSARTYVLIPSEGKCSNPFSTLRKLDMEGCSKKEVNVTLPEYAEHCLTPSQQAEKIADNFLFISQEFEPICMEKFPPRIKEMLEAGKLDTLFFYSHILCFLY